MALEGLLSPEGKDRIGTRRRLYSYFTSAQKY